MDSSTTASSLPASSSETEGGKLRRRTLQQQEVIGQLKAKVESLQMALTRREDDADKEGCARCATWEGKAKQAVVEGRRQVAEMKSRLTASEKASEAQVSALLAQHAQEISLLNKEQGESEREWKAKLAAADRERRQAVREGRDACAREKEVERRLVVEIGRREGGREGGRRGRSEEGGDGKATVVGGREGGKKEEEEGGRQTTKAATTTTSSTQTGEGEGGREGGREVEVLKERLREAEGVVEEVKFAYWKQREVLGRAMEAVAKLAYSEAQHDGSLPAALPPSLPSSSQGEWRTTSLQAIMRLEEEAKTYLKGNPFVVRASSSMALGGEEGEEGWMEELEGDDVVEGGEEEEGGREGRQEITVMEEEGVEEGAEEAEENEEGEGKGEEQRGGIQKEDAALIQYYPQADDGKDGAAAAWDGLAHMY